MRYQHSIYEVYDDETLIDMQYKEIARLEEENKLLLERAEDLEDLLASKATRTTNPGTSLMGDTEVQGRWDSLCFEIRQCVAEHISTPGSPTYNIDESTFSRFCGLPPNHVAVFLRDREGYRLLAQAVIWRILAEHVFGNKTRMSRMFWAGKVSEGARCLCRYSRSARQQQCPEVLANLLTE